MPNRLKVTGLFFDRKAVIDAVGKQKAGVLSRIGAFVRRSARSLIRKRKAIASPGSPPSDHGGALKKLLFFAFDPRASSVVIGPEKFGEGKAPGLLEFGGSTTIQFRSGRTAQAKYHPFPYMGPALKANLSQIPAQWANSVKGK